jgi:uncharacterized protein
MSAIAFNPIPQLATELSLDPNSVAAAVRLLEEGNTVPFIARYRKEATGALDDVQLHTIEERRTYLLELDQRRQAILSSIEEQGKLTEELRQKITTAATKAALEDLYLPYKPKRRTRATVARERGLEPLSARILEQPETGNARAEAEAFVAPDKDVPDADSALAGARDIVAEVIAETAEVRATARAHVAQTGMLIASAVSGKESERTKFEQYYSYREPLRTIPSHRFLAIRRGEREEVLRSSIEVEEQPILDEMTRVFGLRPSSPFAAELQQAIDDSYRRLLAPSVETDIRVELKMRSDKAAVDVFADNLRNLLLAPPFGARAVIGIDPGLRTGCKCAALDLTGKLVAYKTIHLTKGDDALARAKQELAALIEANRPDAIAVGNGTGGRETESFVRELLRNRGDNDGSPFVVQVNEAGASVYSASKQARAEFPKLDVTVRGAISIARRLQDPLAELVKIDPKAIGVGQYQHDVHQPLLQRKLGEVVESSVNRVGVDLNTASAALLSYVAGIGPALAKKIVAYRESQGIFRSREQLLQVSGLGPRAFQQAAGFLRIRQGEHPLDASAVHPERYELVEKMAADLGCGLAELLGNAALADRVELQRYIGDGVGEPTLRDIVDELKRPGRDPRDTFEPPRFRDDVNGLEDLKAGMSLEGVVTNVTAFGAFVDVGVHQDGLVHVSQLADRFVKDPKDVVRVGDKLTVRVLEVDVERKRIGLSARSEQSSGGDNQGRPAHDAAQPPAESRRERSRRGKPPQRRAKSSSGPKSEPKGRFSNNPFAKLANLKRDG